MKSWRNTNVPEETPNPSTEAAKDAESKLADSGAPSEATKPAEDLSGQAPVEASAAAPEASSEPEFKDSVGNVFSADGILLRREDGFAGLQGRKSS